MVLFEENIDSQVITNLIKSVNNNLPLMQKYLSVKGKALGYFEPHLYDYSVPFDNNLKWEYSLEDGIKIIKKVVKIYFISLQYLFFLLKEYKYIIKIILTNSLG